MERAQEIGLVGRGARQMGRHRRPPFSPQQIASVSANGKRERPRWHSRRRAVHLTRRWARLASRPTRFAGRADADALRTARVTGEERALLARYQSGRELVYAKRESFRAAGRSALSICPNDLSPDRTPHCRREVALSAASRGITGRVVRGNVARARCTTKAQEWRLHFDRQFARRGRSAGARQPP